MSIAKKSKPALAKVSVIDGSEYETHAPNNCFLDRSAFFNTFLYIF